MKRPMPWNEQVDVISSDDSSSSDAEGEVGGGSGEKQSANNMAIDQPAEDIVAEVTPVVATVEQIRKLDSKGLVIKRAEMYQEYMKQVPIPSHHGSVIPFTSWMGLARSIKQFYGQPLHYLTNILLKQWDQLRSGTEDEHRPLDTIIHPCKAEASIWLIEEVHRRTSSPDHIAKLWLSDPMHHAFVDPIFPQLSKAS